VFYWNGWFFCNSDVTYSEHSWALNPDKGRFVRVLGAAGGGGGCSREKQGYDPLLWPLFILISQDPDLRVLQVARSSDDSKQTVVKVAVTHMKRSSVDPSPPDSPSECECCSFPANCILETNETKTSVMSVHGRGSYGQLWRRTCALVVLPGGHHIVSWFPLFLCAYYVMSYVY
jgi:hypothetical protein